MRLTLTRLTHKRMRALRFLLFSTSHGNQTRISSTINILWAVCRLLAFYESPNFLFIRTYLALKYEGWMLITSRSWSSIQKYSHEDLPWHSKLCIMSKINPRTQSLTMAPSSPTIKALQLKIFQDFCKLNEKEKKKQANGSSFPSRARELEKRSQRTIPMVERNAMLNEWNYIITELKRKWLYEPKKQPAVCSSEEMIFFAFSKQSTWSRRN